MAEFKPFEGERQELQQRGVTEAVAWLCASLRAGIANPIVGVQHGSSFNSSRRVVTS